MNNTFNLKRFLRLLKKTIFERPMQLFGLSLMMLALVLLIYSSCRDLMGYPGVQIITFFLGLVGGGYFLSASVFNQFATYARGASFLTLPVSAFEKWLCGVVVVLVLYVPLFLGFYRIMDVLLVESYRANLDPMLYNYARLIEHANVFDYNSLNFNVLFKIFINVSGMMLLGSLYFNKMGIIKVAILICAFVFIGIGLNFMFSKYLFGQVEQSFPFYFVSFKSGDSYRQIELPESALFIVNIAFMYVLPILFYVLALLKLREKEF